MGSWFLPLMLAAGGGFAPLHLYDGAWTITPVKTAQGGGVAEHVVNHCVEDRAFYTCEQVVDGKPVVLLVFTATSDPTLFHSQPVRPDGRAGGRSDVTIQGNHWTFAMTTTDDAGKQVWHRTDNFWSGPDRIHYEQYESTDNKTWTKKGAGDEVRGG